LVAASSTFWRVAGSTLFGLFITRETVAVDTCANLATSLAAERLRGALGTPEDEVEF
jgi:hypothetical protein